MRKSKKQITKGENRMYPNIKAEMARKNVTIEMLAQHLKKNKGTICAKLNGKSEFSIPEAEKIRDYLNPALTIDYLFCGKSA